MSKRKRDSVVPEMRDRLLANRDGRITPGQWLDLIVQPLITLAILFGVAFFVFGEMMMTLLDVWWIVAPVLLLIVLLPVGLRAYRYARAPVHFAELYAAKSGWFWKPLVFLTEDDERISFPRRLAPRPSLVTGHKYLIYFLDEPDGKVLLSAAPFDHEDAELWQPTKRFDARYGRRTGRV